MTLPKLLTLLVCGQVALLSQTIVNGSRRFKGAVDASGASATMPARVGTGAPTQACQAGEQYFQSDAANGQHLWGCNTQNTWVQLSGASVGATGELIRSGTNITLQPFRQNFAAATNRRYADKLQESVSVLDCGAKGDGVTDDSAAFNACLAANRTVFVPPPTVKYRWNQTVTLPDRASLMGTESGFESAIDCRTTGPCLLADRGDPSKAITVTVRNLALQGTTGTVTDIIQAVNCWNCDIDHNAISGNNNTGVTGAGIHLLTAAPLNAANNRISRNSFQYVRGWCVLVDGNGGANTLTVEKNLLETCGAGALKTTTSSDTAPISGLATNGNIVEGNGYPFYLLNAQSSVIQNDYFEASGNAQDGYFIKFTAGVGGISNRIFKIDVLNNVLVNKGAPGLVYVDDLFADGLNFRGNTFASTTAGALPIRLPNHYAAAQASAAITDNRGFLQCCTTLFTGQGWAVNASGNSNLGSRKTQTVHSSLAEDFSAGRGDIVHSSTAKFANQVVVANRPNLVVDDVYYSQSATGWSTLGNATAAVTASSGAGFAGAQITHFTAGPAGNSRVVATSSTQSAAFVAGHDYQIAFRYRTQGIPDGAVLTLRANGVDLGDWLLANSGDAISKIVRFTASAAMAGYFEFFLPTANSALDIEYLQIQDMSSAGETPRAKIDANGRAEFASLFVNGMAITGTAAPTSSGPTDFQATVTNGKTAAVTGGTCGWGGTSTIIAPATVVLSGTGNGIIRGYCDPSTQPATLVVTIEVTSGSASLASCTNCTVSTGTAFPPTSDPKFTITFINGAWNSVTDLRRLGGGSLIPQAGTGLQATDSGHFRTLALSGNAYPINFSTPTNSSAACTANTFWFDATYLYLCVTSGTIKRVPLLGGF